MDALEDDDLVLLEAERPEVRRGLGLAAEVKMRDQDLLALVEQLQMLAQQIDVQGLRGLQIGVAAAGGREIRVVLGAVVIIQADHVGEDAPPLQGGADAACGRGLAGGGGSCQQDDLAPVQAGEDDVRRRLHAALIERVALGHVARRVRGQGAVDFR